MSDDMAQLGSDLRSRSPEEVEVEVEVEVRAGAAPRPEGWEVGRDPSCDVVVSHPTVSSRHCRLRRAGDGVWVEDLGSSNGTFVNGYRLHAPARLGNGDRVTLGRRVPLHWRPPAGDPGAAARPSGPEPRHLTIGRDPDCDVVLDDPVVSGRHARLTVSGSGVHLEDLGSTNGTAVGARENRITGPTPLSHGDTVFFGSRPVPAARLLASQSRSRRTAHGTLHLAGRSMVLGRDPSADLVLNFPMISRRHARLTPTPEGIVVEDLGSSNGTFVNGNRVRGRQRVEVGDVVSLGSHTLLLAAPDRLEQRDYQGDLTLEARDLALEIPGRRLVDDVSLTLYPSELVGLMGPSGCGKSTLLYALCGYRPPAQGVVWFNRKNLYQHFDQFRMHVGYVPQEDIIHRDLTVRQALYFSARLRLPADLGDDQIHQRIDRVLSQLGLQEVAGTRIGSAARRGISGGQRKRVNVAMELISDPFILFLDEPTSGLSSEDALTVMKVLRDLADEGKTVLLAIHQPSLDVFRLMDNVAILGKQAGSPEPARLVYYGPAYPDAIHHFNPGLEKAEPSPDLVLRGLGQRPFTDWVRRWQSSPHRQRFVEERASAPVTPAPGGIGNVRRVPGLHQWWTLVRRNLWLKIRDTWNTGILLAQAPVIALLIVAVFGSDGEGGADPAAAARALFMMVVASLWFGASNSAREVVGEWAVYARERMINLKIPSYVLSKLTVLGGLAVVQCLVLLGIVHHGAALQGRWLPMLGVLVLTAATGVALGLLVSSLARSSEVAISLVPLVLLPLVILGGMLKPVHAMNDPMQGVTALAPSRWAFEGLLVLESDAVPPPAEAEAPEPEPAPPPARRSLSPTPEEPAPPAAARVAGAVAPPDAAAPFFPPDRRHSAATSASVLLVFLVVSTAGVTAVLRTRDVP